MKAKSTKRTTNKTIKLVTTKIRKTFILNYINDKGYYTEEYFQSHKEAVEAMKKKSKKNDPDIKVSIDKAEELRLARLGYAYDSKTGKAVMPSSSYARKCLRDHVKWADSLSPEMKKDIIFDYRDFKSPNEIF